MEVAPIIEIYRNGQRITNTTQNVIVGQQIYMTTVVVTCSSCSPNFTSQWTIPGNKVKDYVVLCNVANNECQDPTSGTVTPLTNFSDREIKYYWIDGADGRQVQYTVTVNGRQYSKTATFNVKRPTATVTSQTTDVYVTNRAISFGNYSAQIPGIIFSATTTIPNSFTGDFQWVQIWNKNRVIKYVNTRGRLIQCTSYGVGLDTIYPYTTGTTANDVPEVPFRGIFRNVVVNESYNMYFMFQPTNLSEPTIPVPLQVVDWNWYGEASSSDGINWTKVNRTPTTTVNPSGRNTTNYPRWSINAFNIPYTDTNNQNCNLF